MREREREREGDEEGGMEGKRQHKLRRAEALRLYVLSVSVSVCA